MKDTIKNILLVGIIGLILFFGIKSLPEKDLGVTNVLTSYQVDMIGTRTGTTTTYEYFDAYTQGSTTAIKRIGSYADTVTFTLDARASTTVSGVVEPIYFSIFGSNDQDCETATTTTVYLNQALKREIRWFDIGTNILNLAGSATVPAASSTWTWLGYGTGLRTQIVLTDVNTKCIAFQANASTTDLQVQMLTRSKQGL